MAVIKLSMKILNESDYNLCCFLQNATAYYYVYISTFVAPVFSA